MAYKLKKLGYNDITVFEKTDRVGGKSFTYDHKGSKFDMGTIYTTPEYTEIFKLVTEFNYSSLIPASPRTIWTAPRQYFLYEQFIVGVIAREYGIRDPVKAIEFLSNAVLKYVGLHRALFSEYEGDLFPRPGPETLKQTNGTFLDFLIRYDIEVLKHIFIITYTGLGYGQLDEVSALYGLLWNTPILLLSVINPEDQGIYLLKDGFQGLWQEIVNRKNIRVIFNAEITSIKRRGKVSIRYTRRIDGMSEKERLDTFDFLILAVNMKEMFSSDTIKDPSTEELRIFRKLVLSYFTVTVVESEYGYRGASPVSSFLYSITSKNDHEVYTAVNKYGIVLNLLNENYTSGNFPGNVFNESLETVIYYQPGKTKPTVNTLNEKLEDHSDIYYANKTFTVLKRITWVYSPKFTLRDMTSGILWDILDIQGYQNTWYIGSSVCFESAKSVVEYNKLLLRKFNLN